MRLPTMMLVLNSTLPVACLLPSAALAQVHTPLARSVTLDIGAGSLANAVNTLSRTANVQILFKPEHLRGKRNPAVHGTMSLAEAMRRLLADTGLGYRADADIVIIEPGSGRDAERQEASDDGATSAIVVTGARLQAQEEIVNRRKATGVVDTLTQDDTGNLADQSIAEALRRIPGVTTLYDEDEGQFATVRGTTAGDNYVSLDGLSLASIGNNGGGAREVDLSLIPSQFARRTDVYKTFTADLDAGAIGGVLDIVPRSAYDTKKKNLFIVDAYLNDFTYGAVPGINSLDDPKNSRIGGGYSVIYSQRLGSNEQWGISFAGSYQQKQRDESKLNYAGRVFFNDQSQGVTPEDPSWNGSALAPNLVTFNYTNRLINTGMTGRIELKPSSKFYASVLAFDYIQGESETRNTNNLVSFVQPRDLTSTSGTFGIKEARVAYLSDTFNRGSRGALFRTAFTPDERTAIDLRLGYTYSMFDNTEPEIIYTAVPKTRITQTMAGKWIDFTFDDPSNYLDPNTYTLKSRTDAHRGTYADQYEAKLDFSRNSGASDRGLGVEAGVDWRRFRMIRDNDYIDYVSDKSSLVGYYLKPDFIPYRWNYPVLWVDKDAFLNNKQAKLAINAKASAADSASEDYRYDETVASAYLQFAYATDRLRLLAGGRYDHVDTFGRFPLTANGVTSISTAKGGYRNFLPSASLLYRFGDQLRLKAAYSRTIGRPDPNQLAKPWTRDDENLTISRGNPDLKPRRADNFDLALETYFGDDGLFSVSLFDKQIHDDIFVMSAPIDIDGQTYMARQPLNAESSQLRGIEFLLVKDRIPLPLLGKHLGVSLNASRVWGMMRYPLGSGELITVSRLPDQRKWVGNAAIFYSLPRGGEIRAALSYLGNNIDTLAAQTWDDVGVGSYLTLDVTARFNITKNFIVKAEARNLTNANRSIITGSSLEYLQSEFELGQSYYLHLIYKL